MFRLLRLFRTSIGSKLVVAATGVLLILFLLVHMAGNLTILMGPNALNAYAAWLKGHPLLWAFRIGMVALLALHVLTALRLTLENRAARPVAYRRAVLRRTTWAARLMALSGALVFLFMAYHLFHLTLALTGPDFTGLVDAAGRVDVYARVVVSFQDPRIATLYFLAMGALGWHLLHALPSLFQSFGFNHESYEGLVRHLAPLLALLIVAGFASVPLLVITGDLALPAPLSPPLMPPLMPPLLPGGAP